MSEPELKPLEPEVKARIQAEATVEVVNLARKRLNKGVDDPMDPAEEYEIYSMYGVEPNA